MKCVADLLDLERRVWPRQISSTEMRLAKRQVQKLSAALSQNPTERARLEARQGVRDDDAVPEDFVHFFRAVVYYLLWGILWAVCEDAIAPGLLTMMQGSGRPLPRRRP
jgi:hypothetical protein